MISYLLTDIMASLEENGAVVSHDDGVKSEVATSTTENNEEEKNASNNSSSAKATQLNGSKTQKTKGSKKSGNQRSGDQSSRRQDILEKLKGLVLYMYLFKAKNLNDWEQDREAMGIAK